MKVIRKTSLLAFIATVFALPIFLGGNSYAETFKTNVDIAPKLMVTLPSSPTQVNVDPSYSQFSYNTLSVQISTNNPTGYYTTVSSETTNLIKREDSSKFIPTIEEAGYYSSYSFPVNHWGYSTNNGNTYQPFVSGTRIASKDTAANGDYINMRIATKVDYLQSPGTYEIELTFVTVVNYLPPSYIQDVDPMTCMEEPRTVVDMRDGQEYTIQKLKDGRCWMIDNLNIGAVDITSNLTSANTNINETIAADTFNSWRKTSGSVSFTSAEYIPITAENSNTDTDTDETSGTKFGTLYNYCAVSAGTYCANPGDNNLGDSSYDLCPAGWRLPYGWGSSHGNEFEVLYDAYDNDNDKMRAPISEGGAAFTLSGYFTGDHPWSQGQIGRFWSSTRRDVGAMGTLTITWLGSEIRPNNSTERDDAYSARCILDSPTISQATYLQDVKRAMVYNMNVGDTATLIDKRDGEEYKVAKLADGRLWLLDNLRLDPTTTPLSNLQGNTNAPDVALGYLKNGGGTGVYPAYAVQTTTESYVSYEEPYVITYDKDRVVENTPGIGSGKSGVYYNYCAASAGTLCYTYDEAISFNEAPYDICPKGWKIPSGGGEDKGDWGTLYQAYSRHDPGIKEALSITINAFTSDDQGYYWTSTHSSTREMYIVMFSKNEATNNTQTGMTNFYEDKDYNAAQTVRCILK